VICKAPDFTKAKTFYQITQGHLCSELKVSRQKKGWY
jgi:hypothetical protein